MSDYQPPEIRGYYRSHTHLPVWEVVEQAGIWKQLGIKASFEYCNSSSVKVNAPSPEVARKARESFGYLLR